MQKKKQTTVKTSPQHVPQKTNTVINAKETKNSPQKIVNVIDSNSLPYDPKSCKKKRYEDFIPKTTLNNPFSVESKHSIDFYLENRSSLIIYESSSSIHPSEMKETYSDYSSWVANMKFKDKIHTNEEAKLVVNSYEGENAEKYVIKRCWEPFNIENINTIILINLESFIRSTFNEYSIMKIVNGSPHSVQPIQFHIIHLPQIKYIVTELLMPFGGTPLTKYYEKLTSVEVLEILRQVTNALDYLDSFNIEHNDIKGLNILVDSILEKRIIRLIDLNYGRNISITNKSTQRAQRPGGYSPVYYSPEFFLIEKNLTFSSRKNQIYSLGVLVLYLFGFFPNEMKTQDFDSYKTEDSYGKFLNVLSDSTKNITDPLKRKLMKIAEICLSFNPESRLSAKELKEILMNLENKNIDEMTNQYLFILQSRLEYIKSTKTITVSEHESIISEIKEKFNYTIQGEEKSKNKLIEDNLNLSNKLKEKEEENEKMKCELINLRNLLAKSNNGADKLHNDITENPVFSGDKIASHKMEHKEKLDNQIGGKENPSKKDQLIEVEYEEIEEIIEDSYDKFENNAKVEMMHKESLAEFQILKTKLNDNKKGEPINSKSTIGSPTSVNDINLNFKEINSSQKIKYVEGIKFSENSIYFGPVNQENRPHGAGILIYKDPYRRFIGEFKNGKINNDFGFMVNETETYFFGTIKNGICENISLIYPQISEKIGKYYYCGQTKNNAYNGKGKYSNLEGTFYYEGEWKNEMKEGKGKLKYPDMAYYVGEFKNDKKEGKGTFKYPNREYYIGDYKDDKRNGKGKYVHSIERYYEGYWKDDLKDGRGKHVYLNGDYYHGEWKNGEREGIGKYQHKNGGYYDGEWKNNERNGEGLNLYADGSHHEGFHKDGKKEGKGKLYEVKSGVLQEIQEGVWVQGMKQGKFLITDSNNQDYFRNYKDDEVIQE